MTKRDVLSEPVVAEPGARVLNWFRLDTRKTFFYNEGGEPLEEVAQRSCGCPVTGSV